MRFAQFLLLVSLCARSVFAQTQGATLRGVVTDSSAAVVAGASLTLTNVDQSRSWTFQTNTAGEYVFVQIPPGHYALAVEAPGFKKHVREGLTLEVAQVAELNITLEVGAVNETIDVTAQAPLLESASSTLGEVVNSHTGEALPLNGRNMLQLVQLAPGINTTRAYRNATLGSGSFEAVAFSANGGRNVSNEVMLDGSPQVVMGYNQPAYIPTPDAVQEFRVQTNNLSAEYGRTGGAVINMVHRSGTKEFHGVLYEFLRNDKFDANNFFGNRNGNPRPPFRYNQFGFALGGPLTPSRQTTFFFLNYEGLRIVTPGAQFYTVPTQKMKAGDFSELGFPIYDPLTINAAGQRQAFPGNRIPSGRFDPVAVKLLGYYPDPSLPGIINNLYSQEANRTSGNNVSTKIDRRISDRQNLFGRFSWHNMDASAANDFHNIGSPNAGSVGRHNRSATLDDTYIVGRWVLHGNYGYAYASLLTYADSDGFDLTTLGFPAAMKQASQFQMFPYILPAGYAALGPAPNFVSGNKFETHTWSGDATRLVGSHTLKFGGTFRLNRASNFRPIAPAGAFSFGESWTRAAFNGNTGGNSIASMLLGYMGAGQIGQEPALALQVRYGALYLQDDWRVNSRLMVNLGLRWDSDRPLTERYDRTSWFDLDAPLPIQVKGLGPLKGGLVFAGRNGEPRGNKNPDDNNFAPRIGLAYKLTPRLVLRSGFGIFYNPTTGIGPGTGTTGAISFNSSTAVTATVDAGRTAFTTLSNPFPNGFNQPTNGADGLLTYIGQSVPAQLRYDRVPYSAQWNADLQYEIPGDMLLDVAYAGNAGVKLLASTGLDQLPDQYLALGDSLTERVANPFFGIIPATTALGQQVTTRGQLLRPYPQLAGLTQTWGSLAHSSYHSLQVKFRKRYRGGLQMLAAYTWSKMLDDYSSVAGFLGQSNPGYTDNNKRYLDKSLSALDVAHRLTVNYQYELPFGKGRA
ncbi:MAG: TonB-dependent receptor, partial [Acidobacteria bacterium]|nr:TonB-dependent receptor [Acidobacteriota bacterium]